MNSANAPGGPKRPKFSTARRGFEKDQVEAYLEEMRVTHDKLASSAALAERRLTDASARLEENEIHLSDAKSRITDLESKLESLVTDAANSGNDDENMKSMLEAKERIIDRAKERARQIEDEARQNASGVISKAEEEAARIVAEAPVVEVAPRPVVVTEAVPVSHESVVVAKKEAAVVLARAEQKAAAILSDAKQIEMDARRGGHRRGRSRRAGQGNT